MPKSKTQTALCVEDLRHAEYYGMQKNFDELYKRSKDGETFTDLMDIILTRENILLAYRNIKANTGSRTAGTDKLTISHIGKLTPEEMVEKVRYILTGSKHGYRLKPVRRKEIPKPNGGTRPLGIPCIWDRLIQQCIKQVLEPICEAKFSDNSYGFRPNRSVEHAIARTYQLMQQTNLHYIVEFDIKGFFDNVNHSKLIKQIWSLNIRDKQLIYILRQILKAPIKMPDGTITHPNKGTPQGGIISPLLANIVLNELDQWIESQWEENPHAYIHWKPSINHNGSYNKPGYRWMREKTNLKEMYIVRYADDFRIFCRNINDAKKVKIAVSNWLNKRLKLEISEEKTKVVNTEQTYMEFLGFKIRVHAKGQKYVVESKMSDKAYKRERKLLVEQAKRIANPKQGRKTADEVLLYNSMVMGIQNYYQIATNISIDCGKLNRAVMTILTNRLSEQRGTRLQKQGRGLTPSESKRYGKSSQIRYVTGVDSPIYPIGYIKHKNPMNKKRSINSYSPEGRIHLHDNLKINNNLLLKLMKQGSLGNSAEFMDNKLSRFTAQYGKCAITGIEFTTIDEIHCHHKVPKEKGGKDAYDNLILVLKEVHRLIHAVDAETITKYVKMLKLNKDQIDKVNKYRQLAGNPTI